MKKLPFYRLISLFGRSVHGVGTSVTPLRIAFFGSDEFSVISLEKVLRYQKCNPGAIGDVEVVTRSVKPSGRKLKALVDVPIGQFAEKRGVEVHRADNSEEIMAILDRKRYNLAIAVSYGKLIPPGFLAALEYGGINLHPSLLPQYRGSSPIQYALMNDDKNTGVTLQTLHPTKFDHGEIIAQSPKIPIDDSDNLESLVAKLGHIGGDLLVEALQQRLFQNRHKFHKSTEKLLQQACLAPKIDIKKRQVDWSLSARKIKRLDDALGKIYLFVNCIVKKKDGSLTHEKRKVVFKDVSQVATGDTNAPVGTFRYDQSIDSIVINTTNGSLAVKKLTLQYYKEEDASTFFSQYEKRCGSCQRMFVFQKAS